VSDEEQPVVTEFVDPDCWSVLFPHDGKPAYIEDGKTGQRWDLEAALEGATRAVQMQARIEQLEEDVRDLLRRIEDLEWKEDGA
jgi:hypothetical protein